MKRVIRIATLAGVLSACGAAVVMAQDAKPGQTVNAVSVPSQKAQVPLRIQLVLSRYQGEKKISSVPYSLFVTTNEGRTSLRMSLQVPVPSTTFSGGGGPIASYNLKDVGTNIDCAAEPGVEHGVYKIYLVVSDSTALPTSAIFGKVGDGQQVSGLPAVTFRNFTSTFNILLRDGQTAQYTTATDPVNGEVLKIDATLNVLK